MSYTRLNNNTIPDDNPRFNDYTLLGHSNFDKVAPKTMAKERQILSRQTELGGRRPVIGFQTATSRELQEQTTSDGTRLPDAISWENILQDKKNNEAKVLLTKREEQLKKAIAESDQQNARNSAETRRRVLDSEALQRDNAEKKKEQKQANKTEIARKMVLNELKVKVGKAKAMKAMKPVLDEIPNVPVKQKMGKVLKEMVKEVAKRKQAKEEVSELLGDAVNTAQEISNLNSRGSKRRAMVKKGIPTKVEMPPNSRTDAGKKHKKTQEQAIKEALGAKQDEKVYTKRTYNTRSSKK